MALYHSCGAYLVTDAAADGRSGLFMPDGSLRVIIDDGETAGVYDPSGAYRVSNQTATETFVGAYSPDGQLNVVIVDGATRTGLRASNGALNVVLAS